ncbi:MAG: peptide-methionine (R)-S-oxide reductase MsrB [Bifidobacteriaceae bacterium]|nr:peptide-methionine (R)-S-oxide reductase MsrB [Bifidobacteriaceae bacterium]
MSKEIYLAGGCFWGVQKYLSLLPGVLATETGYANGPDAGEGQAAPAVCYEDVCAASGHVEAVKLTYDPRVAPLRFYLEKLFAVIDPLSRNRQGGDVGVQYRTGVYWTDPADREPVELELQTLQRRYREPIAVESGPLRGFTTAEDHHQDYLDKNPGGYCHISPSALAAAAAAVAPPRGAAPMPDAVGPAGAAGGVAPGRGEAPLPDAARTASGNRAVTGDPAHGGPDPARLAALSPLQRAVTQDGATEEPFTGAYDQVFAPGVYLDVTSGRPLFVSAQKYDAGCGWPSFARPIRDADIRELEDRSYGRVRTEIRAAGSGAHLGHVFEDGPADRGGLRYCVNSAALEFVPAAEMEVRGLGEYLPLLDQPS